MRILLAEDERDMNRILTQKMTEEGYSVDSCYDGEEALDCLLAADYDGAVLDVMMPKLDGFALLKKLRARGISVPVLYLTARDSVEDRVQGLDLGASDYLVKPFSMEEFMARLRALTRRATSAASSVLTAADLTLDLASRRVTRGGEEVRLSAKEFSLLSYLLHHKNQVLSREQIEDHIWNFDYEGGTNVVDVYIRYLRKKLDEGRKPKLIVTVRGAGYMLKDGDPR